MEKEKFDEVWNIINDTATAIQNETRGGAKFNASQKDTIYRHYQNLNKLCKQRHMAGFHESNHYGNRVVETISTDKETLLDRHKVASCMACAIMRVRPMEITDIGNVATNLSHYANEVLAFFVALSIMKSFTNRVWKGQKENDINIDDSSLSKVDEGILKNIVENGYVFPQRHEEGVYLLWQLIALADVGDFTEYVISLSCTLFLIEEYTILSHNSTQQTAKPA